MMLELHVQVHVPQFPRDMGRKDKAASRGNVLALAVGAHGGASYDAIVKQVLLACGTKCCLQGWHSTELTQPHAETRVFYASSVGSRVLASWRFCPDTGRQPGQVDRQRPLGARAQAGQAEGRGALWLLRLACLPSRTHGIYAALPLMLEITVCAPMMPCAVCIVQMARPDDEEVEKTKAETAAALGLVVNSKIAAAQPKTLPQQPGAPTYIKYTPTQQGPQYNSGASQRIIKMQV